MRDRERQRDREGERSRYQRCLAEVKTAQGVRRLLPQISEAAASESLLICSLQIVDRQAIKSIWEIYSRYLVRV